MKSDSLLHRQINPSWVQYGRVTSQAFKPTPKDHSRLSVYDSEQIGAEDAWRHYTQTLGFSSIGVLSVTVNECQSLELSVASDPAPFPEHVVIVFGTFTNSQIEKKSKQLRSFAVDRGWMFDAGAEV